MSNKSRTTVGDCDKSTVVGAVEGASDEALVGELVERLGRVRLGASVGEVVLDPSVGAKVGRAGLGRDVGSSSIISIEGASELLALGALDATGARVGLAVVDMEGPFEIMSSILSGEGAVDVKSS